MLKIIPSLKTVNIKKISVLNTKVNLCIYVECRQIQSYRQIQIDNVLIPSKPFLTFSLSLLLSLSACLFFILSLSLPFSAFTLSLYIFNSLSYVFFSLHLYLLLSFFLSLSLPFSQSFSLSFSLCLYLILSYSLFVPFYTFNYQQFEIQTQDVSIYLLNFKYLFKNKSRYQKLVIEFSYFYQINF